MKSQIKALGVLLVICGCAGTKLTYLPNPTTAVQMRKNPHEIEIMFDGPGRPYDVLGLLEASRYQPGFSDPGLVDVIPEIKFKASQVGGDAAIVRRNASAARSISITAEIIRYRDEPKNQLP